MAALRGSGSVLAFACRLNNKHAWLAPLATGLLGALSQTTWAPAELGVVAFAPLFAALPGTSVRGAFARGFGARFVMVALSHGFVASAASQALGSALQGVLALGAVAVLHALAFGATCALAVALGGMAQPHLVARTVLLFAAVLSTLAELAVPLPFPYPIGMSLADHSIAARSASAFGVHGLSAICYATSASFGALVCGGRGVRWLGPIVAAHVLVVGALELADDRPREAWSVRLRIEGGARVRGEAPTFDATSARTEDLVVLPESFFPETLAEEDVAPLAHRLAGERHPPLLFATSVRVGDETRNRAHLIAEDGRLLGVSDKRVLVPLAEGPLSTLVTRDDAPHDALAITSARVATTICYESLFPFETRDRLREHDADLHVNLANDGWFSDPRPIEAQVRALRIRAIENGVTTVRVSNLGTSAVFLSDGTVAWRGGPGDASTVDVQIDSRRTIFGRLGSIPVLSLLGYALALFLLGARSGLKPGSCRPS